MTITTAKMNTKTLERLKLIKITPRESYDEIINRILNERENNET